MKICQNVNCTREAVMMSSHCLGHILDADKEQQLIKQCSFLYSPEEQCRMPVFDVMSKFAVCSQHQNAVSVCVIVLSPFWCSHSLFLSFPQLSAYHVHFIFTPVCPSARRLVEAKENNVCCKKASRQQGHE